MKKRARKGDTWNELKEDWTLRPGPDPRWRINYIQVNWRFAHTALDGHDLIQEDEQFYTAKDIEDAREKFHEVVASVKGVKEIDVSLCLNFGGLFDRREIFVPWTSEVHIFLVRWREDGAYPESYHFNESRFGERVSDEHHHELGGSRKHPGLMSYWKDRTKSEIKK
jgi:endonuclease IV